MQKTIRILFLAISLLTSLPDHVFAQSVTITGKVTDDRGEGIPGATVTVKGTQQGTLTSVDGNYSVTGNASSILVFSFLGYLKEEVLVGNRTSIDILLKNDSKALEEVVVVGFGTQKKISTVGAQTTVRPDELKLPVRNLNTSLVGRLSGVVGVQRSGEPGNDNAEIFIRGIATLDKGLSQPLVLVDGVERLMNDIDPEDIGSFTILKDASATAVYGVRGANGVIIITTKKGVAGKPKIRLRYAEGVTSFTKLPDLADGITYMNMANEASLTRKGNPIYTQDRIAKTLAGEDPYLYPNVDWYNTIFKKSASNRNANINISGGTETATYYISAGYYNETGLLKTDELAQYNAKLSLDRYNFTSNLTLNASKTTKIELGIQGNMTNRNLPGAESVNTIFGYVMAIPSVFHPVKFDDRLAGSTSTVIINPYNSLTQRGYRTFWTNRLYSNIRLTQKLDALIPGLYITGMFSFDALNSHTNNRTKEPDRWLATGRDANGNLIFLRTVAGTQYLGYSASSSGNRQFYNEASLNYSKTFGKHDVGALMLYNQRDFIEAAADLNLISSLPTRSKGVAARVNYAYDGRYMAEVNFGYNGSENFAAGSRYGFFPSIGLGWVPSEEKFFTPARGVIQFLKFRFTHGLVGNSIIGGRRFAYIGTVNTTADNIYSFGAGQANNAYRGTDVGEYPVNVTWETATKTNLGIELYSLNNKLNVQVDLFRENREGIFLRRTAIPGFIGIRQEPYGNVGVVLNKGIDASMSYNSKIGNVQLQFQGNFTYAKNKIIRNDDPKKAYPWMERVGQKTTQVFGYEALGLFNDSTEIEGAPKQVGDVRPGDLRFKDLNGDGIINQYDVKPIGFGPYPEIVYGFGLTGTYKALTIGAFFQGAARVDIVMNGEGFVPFQAGSERGNLFDVVEDRWTPQNPNPDAFYPRLSFGLVNDNYATNTWFIRNTGYLRLKTLQVGYEIPEKWLKKTGVKSSRLFFIGNNMMTFSKFKLWDVELGSGSGTSYPNVTTYSAGIDINF